MEKRKWVIKSKDHFARVKIKNTKKDGEYYDVVFGLKKEKNRDMHAHFGIKVVAKDGLIGGEIFFTEPRNATSGHREETFNAKTWERISKSERSFEGVGEKVGAELHYATIYDEKKKKLFLTKFELIES